MTSNEKSTRQYWDSLYSGGAKFRLPTQWSVGSRNLLGLLENHIGPGMGVIEIGCAPGRYLAYVAKHLKAFVSGLDYSKAGISASQKLFDFHNLKGDLRCEDIFSTSFQNDTFDVVYSFGLIEHFHDPAEIVRRHVLLLKPGGTALIIIPNYSGFYGKLQKFFAPQNLRIHNTNIMNTISLTRLVPDCPQVEASAFPYGRFSPWLVNLEKKWPAPFALTTSYILNFIGLLQPFEIQSLCPSFVLKLRRI